MLHTMYFADEVRSFDEVDKGQSAKIREGELDLALQLINGLASPAFSPERYTDEYRHRVLEMINRKVEGQEVTLAEAPAPRKKPPAKAGTAAAKAKPAEAAPKKRAQAGRK
jgi:DNA end-binding protein Ku